MPEDHCLVCLLDECEVEGLYVQGRALNDEDAWEAGDLVPDLTVKRGIDDHDVLLVALQVLGPEGKDEVIDGAVEAADNDMVGELDASVDYLGICLALRLHQDIIITLQGVHAIILGPLLFSVISSFFGLLSLALQYNLNRLLLGKL